MGNISNESTTRKRLKQKHTANITYSPDKNEIKVFTKSRKLMHFKRRGDK